MLYTCDSSQGNKQDQDFVCFSLLCSLCVLGALRSSPLFAPRFSIFNFLRWRLSVCPCLFIFLKYFFEFFTFHGERLEVWNLELEGTPEEAVTKFFLQRVEESMNYFASKKESINNIKVRLESFRLHNAAATRDPKLLYSIWKGQSSLFFLTNVITSNTSHRSIASY